MKKSKFTISIAVMLAVSMLSPKTYVHAEQAQITFQDELYTLSTCLKKLLDEKKEAAVAQIESDVVSNGWDYELTMENMQDEDPFKQMDYVRFIAAYMTIKNRAQKDNKTIPLLGDVPLISYTLNEETAEVPVPEKISTYKETSTPGKYIKDKEIYILTETETGKFEKGSDGYFYRSGQETVKVKMEDAAFASVAFHVMTPDELFAYYGFNDENTKEEYERRIQVLSSNTNNTQMYQAMFTKVPSAKSAYNLSTMVEGYMDASVKRRVIAEVANSLVGQVPYQWGGKARKAGYDDRWWLFNEENEQIGLDCSGFVQWVYITAGYAPELYDKMVSTNVLLESDVQEISKDQLRIGDIGIKVGQLRNHMGIYAGKINGKDMWIHCNSNAGTVSVNEFEFQKFYSPLRVYDADEEERSAWGYSGCQDEDSTMLYEESTCEEFQETPSDDYSFGPDADSLVLDENKNETRDDTQDENFFKKNEENDIDNIKQMVYSTYTESQFGYSDEDVHLLAQLTIHEAGNEGLNGWVAVIEVVKNRVEAGEFPNSIPEVIYQAKQFSHSEAIASITPTEEVINTVRLVLEGKISVLGNSRCLYFRNPMITDGISVTAQVDWGKYKYYKAVGNHAFYLQP